MQALVRAAMRDGAIGFTSSQLELHVAHDGRGVPSNYAAPDELVALAGVLAEFGRGSIEFIPRTFLDGYDDADRDAGAARWPARSGRPVHLNTLTAMPHAPDGWKRSLEFAESAAARRPRAPPDVRGQPAERALRARVDVPVRRDAELPRHAHAAVAGTRATACANPRSATRCGPSSPTRVVARSCSRGRSLRVETVQRPEHERYLDRIGAGDRRRARRRSARCLPRPLARRGPRDAVRARHAAVADPARRRRDDDAQRT